MQDESIELMLYRHAYAMARRVPPLEGRDPNARRLARAIARRIGVEASAIRAAVEDALAGRDPAW